MGVVIIQDCECSNATKLFTLLFFFGTGDYPGPWARGQLLCPELYPLELFTLR
jgi:hypothetical protein